MATGPVDNWLNIDTFCAIYPFIGTEMMLTIAGFAFWLIWHFLQLRKEKEEFAKDIENISKQGGPGAVLDDESRREIEDQVGQ